MHWVWVVEGGLPGRACEGEVLKHSGKKGVLVQDVTVYMFFFFFLAPDVGQAQRTRVIGLGRDCVQGAKGILEAN